MSSINIYDKETKTWKSVASNHASNITTTNSNLVDNGNTEISLDKALDKICEKINILQSNTAWLATYGGGGNGGGSTINSAEVIVTNADVSTNEGKNVVYFTSKSYNINYAVKASRSNQKYYVTINLDGTDILVNKEVYSNVQQTFSIDDLNKFTAQSPHKLIITAYDSDEINVTPYNLIMNESSIKLSAVVEDNKSSISAAIGKTVNLSYVITSKIIGQDITLSVRNEELGIDYITILPASSTASNRNVTVDFFKNMFGTVTPVAGSTYRITAQASVPLGEIQVLSEKITTSVVIEDSSNLVIITDGITKVSDVTGSTSATTFSKGGNISFSFTPYLADNTIIYYAIKITYNGKSKIIGDLNNYLNNSSVTKGNTKVFSLSIPDEEESIGEWSINLTCWSEKGSPTITNTYICNVIQSNNSLLTDPNPESKRYASWNSKSALFPTNTKSSEWNSIEEYTGSDNNTNTISTLMNIYGINGSKTGFLNINNQPLLRLFNESYATINLNPFVDEPTSITNWSKSNFTMSFTFKTDKHPYKNKTVAFCGIYSKVNGHENEMLQGIKIGLENVSWRYKDGTLDTSISCKIEQNVLNTVDFVKSDDTIKIYKNGVLQVAREIDDKFSMNFDSNIYLACDKGNNISNFCDVDFFDVRFFRKDLTPKEIVVNAMNAYAKSTVLSDGTIDYSSYGQRKNVNFFDINGASSSMLFDDDNQKFNNISFTSFVTSQTTPPLPILSIKCAGSSFTRDVYERLGSNSTIYGPCNGSYYDPNSTNKEQITFTNLGVQIQGTSSVNYRSKNIELYFQGDAVNKDGTKDTSKKELFQPKASWMPENRFTLKSDVVDSAHANNASIGNWINENASILFEDTPPMAAVKAHPIKDTIDTGTTYSDVTVKHTLEGFPIILMIQFDNESTETMLGIYSFNLGRGAYFNMGFQFLKNFTRKTIMGEGNYKDHNCPALVKTYEVYNKGDETKTILGIDESQVYSYEFGLNENVEDETSEPTGLFWQDDLSIIQYQGEFKYNGSTMDSSAVPPDSYVWKELQYLFTDLAGLTGTEINKYIRFNNKYILGNGTYPANSQWGTIGSDLIERLCVKNAYTYFMISIIFGLVDSLGKNMTLRSWNVSNTNGNVTKWYPCFYDMDTANGESNIGNDDVPKTAYIDTYNNTINPNGVNTLEINSNDKNGSYDEFSSRLWNVLRDSRFKNAMSNLDTYETLWSTYRNNEKLLKDANYYVDNFFTEQTKNCGELLYNFDYDVKYLTKYKAENSSVETYANIEFLHGTRTEFVRDWLTKRFIFLDGVFSYKGVTLFPYNTNGTFALGGSDITELTLRATAPTILAASIAQKADYFFYLPEDEDTTIRLGQLSSFNTQISLNNVSIISKIGGLTGIRYQGMKDISLPSLSEFDISNDTYLNSEPIDFKKCFVNENGKISLRHLNLSNVNFMTNNDKNVFTVDLTDYDKLKDINISHSCVSSIALPFSNLSELHIDHCGINAFTLSNQEFLETIDITGCDRLTNVVINDCRQLTTLNFSNLADLAAVTITNCPNITSITCSNNSSLTSIKVIGCTNLLYVDFSKNSNPILKIEISAARNLKEVYLYSLNTTTPPILPQVNTNLVVLNLANTQFDSIQFGNKSITQYNNENVLDLSMFFVNDSVENGFNVDLSKLNLNVQGMANLKYLKLNNDSSAPFIISSNFFSGCKLLKRVFGYISLNGNNIFNGCINYGIRFNYPSHQHSDINFDINDDFSIDTFTAEGKIKWNTLFDASNIIITTDNISSEFASTNISLYDVYYILMNKCSNVRYMNSTFSFCGNIITSIESDSINRYLFRQCGNVITMNSLFWGSFKNGSTSLLYSPEHATGNESIINYNGLLSPLKSLIDFSGAFNCSCKFYCDDMLFYPLDSNGTKLKISTISHLASLTFIKNASSLKTSISNDDLTYALASHLLTYLPELTNITLSFNSIWFNFDLQTTIDNIKYCPLFFNNTKLTRIERSFNGLKGQGSLLNIFGGNAAFDNINKFPKSLEYILTSFNIDSYDISLGQVDYPIHNNMFRQIKKSLIAISDNTLTNTTFDNPPTFCGNGLNKRFLQENGESFPYDIFNGMTKLKELVGLFAYMDCQTSDGKKRTGVKLPDRLFVDTTSVTNLSSCFLSMKNIEFTLTSKSFINCSLNNVSSMFYDNTQSITGKIPYGLFYQEHTLIKTFNGLTHDDAIKLGIKDENYGIDSNGEWISGSTNIENKIYNENVREINPTINKMRFVLQYITSAEITPYSIEMGSLTADDYGDLLVINPNYQPIEYIKNPLYNPLETVKNPDYNPSDSGSTLTVPNPKRDIHRILKLDTYDPYHFMWNIYAVDGDNTTNETILKETELYAAILNGTFNEVSPIIPSRMDGNSSNMPRSGYKKMSTNNYLCPPDLFRYCSNISSLSIQYALADSEYGEFAGIDTHQYGLCGRIPPYIFEPISNVTDLSGVFANIMNLSPWDWGNTITGVKGKQYPKELFSMLKNLQNVSGIFQDEQILENIEIPNELFKNNRLLTNISSMWQKCSWEDVVNNQIPSSLFDNNHNLYDTSYLFQSWGDSNDASGRSPKIIDKNLFTYTKHPYLSNIRHMYYNARNTSGTVPEFWTWPNGMSNYDSVFFGISKSKITNSSNMPTTYSGSMIV